MIHIQLFVPHPDMEASCQKIINEVQKPKNVVIHCDYVFGTTKKALKTLAAPTYSLHAA